MPRLIIDNRPIEVPEGTKVIEAAERLGIMIPRFCYHPALGSVGACRMCAVKFLQGPVKGVQMSCMIDARDDIVVSTTDEEVVDFRRHMIEWLMLNHPHDCPVCDEGGHCLLQDMTVSGGHGLRRYLGKKRTHHDQDLGPLVQHEMNRCIQCYRCTRYYQEFCGYRDLGVMQIGSRVYFGRYKDGELESPFSGNLLDICPTGVYTDKPSRFSGRRWDFERSPSVCIHCSLGCHTTVSVRYRRLIRQEARFSSVINGHFICDRGRYGFYYGDLSDHPRQGRINGKEAPRSDALGKIARKLDTISRKSGPGSIACAGSARSSIQTLAMLKALCRQKGWPAPAFWTEASQAAKVQSAAVRLEPKLAVSLREIEKADFILALGVDPVNEAPMLALAFRQAQRRGAKVIVIDPRPVHLPFEFEHLPASPESIYGCLGALLKLAVDRAAAVALGRKAEVFFDALPDRDLPQQAFIEAIVPVLGQSSSPVIVCGTDSVPETLPVLAADAVLLLQGAKKQAGLFYVLPGANAFGAALLSENGCSLEQILAGIENGKIKALVLVECDPLGQFPDRQRLESALNQLELLVVMDQLNSLSARRADVFVATATVFEAGGIFINQEGRAQQVLAAYHGGPSIVQTGAGSHPPRTFQEKVPDGSSAPAWLSLATLAENAVSPDTRPGVDNLQAFLRQAHPLFAGLPAMDDFPVEGVRLLAAGNDALAFQLNKTAVTGFKPPDNGLTLFLAEQTFGTEELSAYSPCLISLHPAPCVFIHSTDARRLGLTDGDAATIQTEQGVLKVLLCVQDRMAAGTLVLPRQRQLAWQIFKAGHRRLSYDQIRKAERIK
jgi:NADH-quinone oxidoreductase subunit G